MAERNPRFNFFRYRLFMALLGLNIIFSFATFTILESKAYLISENLRSKNYIYGSGVYILNWGFSVSDYLKDFNKQ